MDATLIIRFLGCLAAFASIWEYFRFRRENEQLARVIEKATAQQGSSKGFFDAVKSLEIGPAGQLVIERLSLVRRLKAKRTRIVLSDLSQLSEEGAEHSLAHRTAKFFLAAMLVLGVGVTFWKLIDTLEGDTLAKLASPDPRLASAAASTLKKGFQEAFRSSVSAIGSTAVLLFIQHYFTEAARSRFFTSLDHFTQFELLPLFAQEEMLGSEQILLSVAQKLGAVTGDIAALGSSLAETFATAKNTTDSLDKFTSNFGDMVETFTNAIGSNSRFHETIENLYKSVSAAERRHLALLDQFAKNLEAAQTQNEMLLANQRHLGEFAASVDTSQGKLLQSATALTDAAKGTIDQHLGVIDRHHGVITGNLEAMSKHLREAVAEALKASAAARHEAEGERTAVRGFVEQAARNGTDMLAAIEAQKVAASAGHGENRALIGELSLALKRARKEAVAASGNAAMDRKISQTVLVNVESLLEELRGGLTDLKSLRHLPGIEHSSQALESFAASMPGLLGAVMTEVLRVAAETWVPSAYGHAENAGEPPEPAPFSEHDPAPELPAGAGTFSAVEEGTLPSRPDSAAQPVSELPIIQKPQAPASPRTQAETEPPPAQA